MIIPFAKTNFRNKSQVFGIQEDDRRRHMYVIGKTGTGKTTMLRNMMIFDVLAGNGVTLVDPHGEFAEAILDYVPEERIDDVVYFNPADVDFPIAFNAVEKVDLKERHLVSSGLVGIFKKIWADSWGPRLEYVLRNAILALLEYPESTLLGVLRILSDKEYRKIIVENLTDPVVKQFWINEFGKYSSKFEVEAIAPIQNKVGQFLTNPMIRNIVGQTKSSIHMRDIMDSKKIFIMDLSKGKIGEDSSALIGAMLITKIQQAAMSRINIPEEEREDSYLYVDEFQNFATESFAGILSEARKYRLCMTLAHQYIAQLEEPVRDAVVGNAGTLVAFRVGADDAEFLEKEFAPEVAALDLVNLPNQKIYLKLMINGVTSRAFSADTLPPIPRPQKSFKDEIIRRSRAKYGMPRALVEEQIASWSNSSGLSSESHPKEARVFDSPLPAPLRFARESGAGGSPYAAPVKRPAEQSALHDAVCALCGVAIKVPFIPDPKRQTFCKKCLPKFKQMPKRTHDSLSLEEAFASAPASFNNRVHGEMPAGGASNTATPKLKKKEPDVEGLRSILEKSLKEIGQKPKHNIDPKDLANF